jgi:hypothetical protein
MSKKTETNTYIHPAILGNERENVDVWLIINYVWLMIHHGFHYPLFLMIPLPIRGVAKSGCK